MEQHNNKKHIAMYIGSLQKGGAEHVMVNLAEYFWSRGYHVTLVTTYLSLNEYEVPHASWEVVKDPNAVSDSDIVDAIVAYKQGQKCKVNLHGGMKGGIDRIFSAIDDSGLSRLGAFKKRFDTLKNIWKDIRPDLILSFIGKNNLMAIMTARSLHIPVVVSVRAKFEMEYPSKAMKLAMRYTFPKAAGVVLQSRGASMQLPESIKKKTVVLPNSINPDFIRDMYRGKRDKTIVTVGRIDENKNHKLIIDAFNKIRNEYPDYELHIYGDGPDRDKLFRYAGAKGLNDKVIFEGSVTDVADKIQASSMFVLASDMEGMPNALIEAMSLGIPCITTDCMYDTSELVKDNINGIVIPKGDVDAMAVAMKKLMDDPEYASKLGDSASRIKEEVAPDVINRKWEDYFQSIMR
ncbi:MAG: glycosyltransferase [Butyrivibrio sp.]|uniref:glycosyltransferase n=1 Tax=Butyrivibrio sp. TaxID=28121 RepID=UPI0025EC3F62|nr:glycosyltransferase [Butyrivibrio sp.]MCR5770248.1 glycosyltransferase [Butyrivibrio sp.]